MKRDQLQVAATAFFALLLVGRLSDLGMGAEVDKTTAQALSVGGYALMPANANHFAYTTGETTVVLYGQGPVEFKYVNPSDDPRNLAGKVTRK